jgi:uncharacterized protein YbjT (DUF2867 family)
VIGDLTDRQSLTTALEGIEKVYLVMAADLRQPEFEGNMIEAAHRSGVRHIVKLSVMGASEHSPVLFGRNHAQVERHLRESGIPHTLIRPNFFMQNLLSFAPTIRSEGVLYAPMKDGKVSMIDVRDIAAVAATALTHDGHEGKTYEITGPEAISFEQVAEKLSNAIHRQVRYVDVALETAREALIARGMPDWYAEATVKLLEVLSAGMGAGATSTVQEVTGKAPHTFDDFARDHAEAFKGEFASAGANI